MIREVYAWVREIAVRQQAQSPVLEIGSFNVNGSVRDLFFGQYVGLDMREGPGVDVIADIVEDGWLAAYGRLYPDPPAPGPPPPRFRTVIATETLEHVTDPWKAVEQMYAALEPDGLAIVSIPFLWNFHDFPSDYWRLTPPGLELLFERAGFTAIDCRFGGQAICGHGEEVPCDQAQEHTLTHTLGIARRPA